jgi:CGNR zinc finger
MKPERAPSTTPKLITREDRLRFVVRFAQMDLATLRAGDWLNLREDFVDFLQMTPGKWYSSQPMQSLVPDADAEDGTDMWQPLISLGMHSIIEDGDVPPHAFAEDDFRALQEDVRGLLRALTHRTLLHGPKTWSHPVDISAQAEPSGEYGLFVKSTTHRLFLLHLIILLLQEPGDRIRRCPECATYFYGIRTQTYCSRTCGNRVTQRRWRARHDPQATGQNPTNASATPTPQTAIPA